MKCISAKIRNLDGWIQQQPSRKQLEKDGSPTALKYSHDTHMDFSGRWRARKILDSCGLADQNHYLHKNLHLIIAEDGLSHPFLLHSQSSPSPRQATPHKQRWYRVPFVRLPEAVPGSGTYLALMRPNAMSIQALVPSCASVWGKCGETGRRDKSRVAQQRSWRVTWAELKMKKF